MLLNILFPKSPINQPCDKILEKPFTDAPPMSNSAHGFGTESNSDTAQQNTLNEYYLSEDASDVIKAGSKSYMNYRERAEWLKNNKPLSGDTEPLTSPSV
jgi:hypothetical protein